MRCAWATLAALTVVGSGVVPALAAEPRGLEIGQAAPRFFLPRMNATGSGSRMFKLADYVGRDPKYGGRGVILNFAASYCVPCRAELAELKSQKERLDSAEVTLAVVVIDKEREGIETMRALTVDRLELPFAVLSDRFGVLARRYGVSKLPMSIVIDRRGRVRWVTSGFKPDTIETLLAQAERLPGPEVDLP